MELFLRNLRHFLLFKLLFISRVRLIIFHVFPLVVINICNEHCTKSPYIGSLVFIRSGIGGSNRMKSFNPQNDIVNITLLYIHSNEKEALIKTRDKDFQDVEIGLRKSIKTQDSLLQYLSSQSYLIFQYHLSHFILVNC